MTLRTEVVDLVRLEIIDQFDEVHGVGQVAVVKEKLHSVYVGILVKMINAIGVEGAGAADDSVDLITFAEQEFGQIGAVLSCDAGD